MTNFDQYNKNLKKLFNQYPYIKDIADKRPDLFILFPDLTNYSVENSKIYEEKNWKKLMVRKHIVTQLATKRDWILTAEEAVNYGFADGTLGSKKFPNIDYIKNVMKKAK